MRCASRSGINRYTLALHGRQRTSIVGRVRGCISALSLPISSQIPLEATVSRDVVLKLAFASFAGTPRQAVADGYSAVDAAMSAILSQDGVEPPRNHNRAAMRLDVGRRDQLGRGPKADAVSDRAERLDCAPFPVGRDGLEACRKRTLTLLALGQQRAGGIF